MAFMAVLDRLPDNRCVINHRQVRSAMQCPRTITRKREGALANTSAGRNRLHEEATPKLVKQSSEGGN